MKNILALVGLVIVLFAGLGWYLGWYKVATEPAADGHRKINVDLDTKKITTDIKTGTQKVGDVIHPEAKGTASTNEKKEASGLQINPDGSATLTFPKLEIKTGP